MPLASSQGNFPNLNSPTTSSSASPAAASKTTAASSASQAATTTSPKLPNIDPTTTAANNGGIPKGQAPTVTFNNGPGIQYAHAAPSVPPTKLAPYMQKSSLPSGTVFIIVGAALGFFFFLVVAWRGVVAYSLRRSVKRANNQPVANYNFGSGERTSMLRNAAPFYSHRPGSQMSLDQLGAKGNLKAESKTNLFFSPTAGGIHQHQPANRASTGYLPAGYYAAGNAAPGGVPRPISMADFTSPGMQSQGYQRARSTGPSPPASLYLHSQPGGDMPDGRGLAADSSLSLPSQGRAPSAYLEDLFDVPPLPENGPLERYRD
jgi:hypothetical protein